MTKNGEMITKSLHNHVKAWNSTVMDTDIYFSMCNG